MLTLSQYSSVISGTAGETKAEYKLTLLDNNMTIAGNGDVTRRGDTVTIPYTITGNNSGNATQVSVLILDREYSDATKDEAALLQVVQVHSHFHQSFRTRYVEGIIMHTS